MTMQRLTMGEMWEALKRSSGPTGSECNEIARQLQQLDKRPRSPVMDFELDREHRVLDKGFIRVVDYMGNDDAICQAARVSYGTGTKSLNEDRGLIRYLMRHRHTTPFEMCELKIHVKLPVFVARQWIRHRTANVNEYSARYSILDNEFYFPHVADIQPQSKTNKQGRDGTLPEDVRWAMLETIRQHSEGSYQLYDELRTGSPWFHADGNRVHPEDDYEPHEKDHGMARESARMVLPPNIYTQWYWKVDLHNLLHFLSLRADPHAQMEIRAYAEVLCDLVRQWVPHTFAAFEDYVMGSETFSRQEMQTLRTLIRSLAENPSMPLEELGPLVGLAAQTTQISDRERGEFWKKLLQGEGA